MAKRMSDDDVMDYVYTKLFGDLDGMEAQGLFDKDDTGLESGTADNAEPATENAGGVSITVKPLMKGAEESGKETDKARDGEDEDEDDDLRGIGGMSPLMAQLHGDR